MIRNLAERAWIASRKEPRIAPTKVTWRIHGTIFLIDPAALIGVDPAPVLRNMPDECIGLLVKIDIPDGFILLHLVDFVRMVSRGCFADKS